MKNALRLLSTLVIAAVVFGFIACTPKGDDKILIGVSLPTQREERWAADYSGFRAAAEKLGVEVIIQIADNDAARQQSQVENMITQGAQALIIAPHDAVAARQLIVMAHREDIPVIAYVRPITDGNADLYIYASPYGIGRAMGQYLWDNVPAGNIVFMRGDAADDTSIPLAQGALDVLQPRIDEGTYRIVMDQNVRGWEPSNALNLMEQALTANANNIAGVIAPNDGTAGGIIQALAAQGMAGLVPVTGQDSEIDAVRRIREGTQGMTVLNDNVAMTLAALEAAIRLINGEDTGASDSMDDGTPVLDFTPRVVNRETYRQLIEDGLINEADL